MLLNPCILLSSTKHIIYVLSPSVDCSILCVGWQRLLFLFLFFCLSVHSDQSLTIHEEKSGEEGKGLGEESRIDFHIHSAFFSAAALNLQ